MSETMSRDAGRCGNDGVPLRSSCRRVPRTRIGRRRTRLEAPRPEAQVKIINELRERNLTTERQRDELSTALALRDEFTGLVLSGQSIDRIAAVLGQRLANPVAVLDRFFSPIAQYAPPDSFSNGEAWREQLSCLPMVVRRDAELQKIVAELRIATRLRPTFFGLGDPSVIAPAVVDGGTIGYLLVVERDRAVDQADVIAVDCARLALALAMMREKVAEEIRHRLCGDLIVDLLGSAIDPGGMVYERAAYLGIDLRVSRTILLVEIDSHGDLAAGDQKLAPRSQPYAKVLPIVQRVCHRLCTETVVSMRSNEIVVLVPGSSPSIIESSIGELADCVRTEIAMWVPGITVSIGVGGVADNGNELWRSYQQARFALEVIRTVQHRDRTLHYRQLLVSSSVANPNNNTVSQALTERAVGLLLEHDRRHGGELTETLTQYLKHDCHVERASQALCVHFNTLRYRLERIQEITGVDMKSFETRCNLYLALRLAECPASSAVTCDSPPAIVSFRRAPAIARSIPSA